jgi:hypothetical protein
MTTRLSSKEILSWFALLIAILLFSSSLLFAQPDKERDNGQVTVRIHKDHNGESLNIDTTFDFNDKEALKEILENLDLELQEAGPGAFKMRSSIRSAEIRKLADEAGQSDKDILQSIDEAMSEAERAISEINIHASDAGGESFHFSFSMPDCFMSGKFQEKDGVLDPDCKKACSMPDCIMKCCDMSMSRRGRIWTDHKPDHFQDSLMNEEYFVLPADDDESVPVYEREIIHPDGSRSYLFKRQFKVSNNSDQDLSGIANLRYYPNPADEIINISFESDSDAEALVEVLNTSGNILYSEKIPVRKGSTNQKLDIGKIKSGTYILKITREGSSVSKKLIIK